MTHKRYDGGDPEPDLNGPNPKRRRNDFGPMSIIERLQKGLDPLPPGRAKGASVTRSATMRDRKATMLREQKHFNQDRLAQVYLFMTSYAPLDTAPPRRYGMYASSRTDARWEGDIIAPNAHAALAEHYRRHPYSGLDARKLYVAIETGHWIPVETLPLRDGGTGGVVPVIYKRAT